MRKFYISSQDGTSGISKYSRDFYRLILLPRNYIYIDSKQSVTSILSTVSSRDHAHIEIGIFQKREIEVLFTMLRANYKNVSVTLHDAPLVKYPFFGFKNKIINSFSKAYDKYANSLGAIDPYVRKIKAIFVLSRRGVDAVKKRYQIENVYYLPHIVDQKEIQKNLASTKNFIYFGFIGKNKGLDYALKLHRKLLDQYPTLQFYVVGEPLDPNASFYKKLQTEYARNVHFLGFVPETRLQDVFEKATFAMLLFKEYKFFSPLSGSILYSLTKGKIVLSNNVNSIGEIIQDGKTGYHLTGKLVRDVEILKDLMENSLQLKEMGDNIVDYLISHHCEPVVSQQFKD